MRALVCHELAPDRAGLRVHVDWPEPPSPGPGQYLIAVRAVGLNYPDHLMLEGGYQYRPDLPFIPGTEGCGVVLAAGEGAPLPPGTRVLIGARSGLMADRITLPASAVRPVPAGLDDAEAACFTVGALTAWVGLMVRGRLKAGERVLVAGAGGGMGRSAVQLAAHMGAHVVALASTAERAAIALAAGAHEAHVVPRDASALPVGDFDLVFDPVGGALALPMIRALRRGGRYAIIGFTAGRPAPVPLNRLLLKEIELVGVRAGEQGRQDPAAGAAHIAAIDALGAVLRPHIGLAVPLERAAEAFAAMAGAALTGKAVINIDG
jgi:NADPH2:quinone reductase